MRSKLHKALLACIGALESVGWVIAPEDLAVLKAFSDRPRDFLDLVTLVNGSNTNVDLRYVEEWARTLDASIGTDEVSERVRKAMGSRGKD